MKIRNGFTLVELLACIILLAIISVIAVPAALNLANKVKTKSYESKIEIMEKNAVTYGQTNLSNVRSGLNPFRGGNFTCKFTYNSNGDITRVDLQPQSGGYNEMKVLGSNEYWCFRLTLEELVDAKNLNWDDSEKKVIKNPKDEYIINKCFMYLYYKNKRVNAYFDVNTCNISSDTPQEGQQYRPTN